MEEVEHTKRYGKYNSNGAEILSPPNHNSNQEYGEQ